MKSILLSLCFTAIFLNSFLQVNVNDSLALVDLYNSTDGAHWTNNAGWLNGPVNKWAGVITSNGRVIEIRLWSDNLMGTLPNSIGNIIQLGYLNLDGNRVSGPIPSSMGNLVNLSFLDLGVNC